LKPDPIPTWGQGTEEIYFDKNAYPWKTDESPQFVTVG